MQYLPHEHGQPIATITAVTAFAVTALLTALLPAPVEARESVATLRGDIDSNAADIAILATSVPVVSEDVILVNSLADDADPADGQCTLREAISAANESGDSAPTTDGECDAGSRSGGATQIDLRLLGGAIVLDAALPPITADMIIEGPGKNALAIDGDGSHAILAVAEGAVVVIDAVTLRNAAGPDGGAIRNSGNLTVTDSIFTGNDGGAGGGGAIKSDAELFVSGSTFFENSAAQGGAISAAAAGNVTLLSNVMYDNRARVRDGGAVFLADVDNATVAGSTIFANSAENAGGAIYFGGSGSLAAIRNTIANNRAAETGGAIEINPFGAMASVLVTESTLFGNSATDAGGAIRVTGSASELSLQLFRNLFGVPTANAAPEGPNVSAGTATKLAEGNLPGALACDGASPDC
jgi:CSLREA domain-containing protein